MADTLRLLAPDVAKQYVIKTHSAVTQTLPLLKPALPGTDIVQILVGYSYRLSNTADSGLTKKRQYSEIGGIGSHYIYKYNKEKPYLGLGNGQRYWGGGGIGRGSIGGGGGGRLYFPMTSYATLVLRY